MAINPLWSARFRVDAPDYFIFETKKNQGAFAFCRKTYVRIHRLRTFGQMMSRPSPPAE
jgi:hypothetical protein